MKYNGEYANICGRKSTVCDMDEFIERISKYIHNDFDKQCGVTSESLSKIINLQIKESKKS